MREIWFVRHGQSETNAGLPSDSDSATPLTDLGKAQAGYVVKAIQTPPDLIILSPYIRTSQTAAPTLAKYPEVSVETWPIQEFSYLSYAQYAGTTTRDRRHKSIKYFLRGDPDHILGEGGESFNQFIHRVEQCFDRLAGLEQQRIVLFGHGWFIRAGLWILLQKAPSKNHRTELMNQVRRLLASSHLSLNLFERLRNKSSLWSFLLFSAAVQTPNCSILKYQLGNETGVFHLTDLELSHLPEEFRKVSLRNR